MDKRSNNGAEFLRSVAGRVRAKNQYATRFYELFRVPIRHFWDGNVFGFDLLRFDREIVRSGDRALRDVLREQWGEEAVMIIEALIK